MRFALGVEYNGANYSGWQRQGDKYIIGVQQRIEEALSKIANTPIEVVCAGRTDAGVHATGQVVHFDSPIERPNSAWTLGMNTLMPEDIAIRWAQRVDVDFDARFSATARRYRYVIYNDDYRPAILVNGLTHIYSCELDADKMHQAAQALVGEHDFTSFRAAHCQSNTPFRNLTHINVTRQGKYIVVDVQANAFLHHMVRNIVGSLIEVGAGEQTVEWIGDLLTLKDRTQAGVTAKPNGLYLVKVFYPDALGIPTTPLGPLFLADN
ncbi:tRNA pseudouridine(38-40) synthase TruA [Catenovulum sp. SM1970]|uniref:tRNA pseudouridine(38-40) synthase TruA n=1 Tax=Marinifaba aquimaris TaxID=2741323 RepID=UPI0015720EFB|nr:tRNA pseudouridine(38-40) synthase TruA [Marinifaba aquimaris]NTS77707.1 tRNA pseudouridine(38-40) synthase TruA [Marinifaba aquimaris]